MKNSYLLITALVLIMTFTMSSNAQNLSKEAIKKAIEEDQKELSYSMQTRSSSITPIEIPPQLSTQSSGATYITTTDNAGPGGSLTPDNDMDVSLGHAQAPAEFFINEKLSRCLRRSYF